MTSSRYISESDSKLILSCPCSIPEAVDDFNSDFIVFQ